MSLDQLVIGSYVYTTLVMTTGLAGFLYLASWLREIMTNHIHALREDVDRLKQQTR